MHVSPSSTKLRGNLLSSFCVARPTNWQTDWKQMDVQTNRSENMAKRSTTEGFVSVIQTLEMCEVVINGWSLFSESVCLVGRAAGHPAGGGLSGLRRTPLVNGRTWCARLSIWSCSPCMPCNIDPLSQFSLRRTHTLYKLANEMQQHVCHTPLLRDARRIHSNSQRCRVLLVFHWWVLMLKVNEDGQRQIWRWETLTGWAMLHLRSSWSRVSIRWVTERLSVAPHQSVRGGSAWLRGSGRIQHVVIVFFFLSAHICWHGLDRWQRQVALFHCRWL